jgi:vancomycin resistance protein VanW
MEEVLRVVNNKLKEKSLSRKALTLKYPKLLPIVLGTKRFVKKVKDDLNLNISKKKSTDFFSCVIARHSSPLFRKLGESDPALQVGKVRNLETAISKLQGVVIPPGKTFSFWSVVGATTAEKGFVDGMLLSDGRVIKGVGGGLCQLSNLLYWLFLHSPVKVIERQHHSKDVFPDSGRTIPFGTGATIFYNLIDLKVKNTSNNPLQLKLWLTDNQLKGQILSIVPSKNKYHVFEKKPYFIKTPKGVYRYNEVWRETLLNGEIIKQEKLMTNCAPVLYETDRADLIVL